VKSAHPLYRKKRRNADNSDRDNNAKKRRINPSESTNNNNANNNSVADLNLSVPKRPSDVSPVQSFDACKPNANILQNIGKIINKGIRPHDPNLDFFKPNNSVGYGVVIKKPMHWIK